MSLLARIASAVLLAGVLHTALARDEAVSIRVEMLVPFASAEGLDRLGRVAERRHASRHRQSLVR